MRTRIGNQFGELTNMPGCSQIVVSHDVFCPIRGSGMGKSSNKERIEYCEYLGYDALVCTVNMSNYSQLSILDDNGWILAFCFTSKKTEHRVGLYYRVLNND